ncbi:retrovirus-related pol polyprotein from transposon TNT 1-94 [Tanacetum coccineum]|uniref:Retrovirus-related pol polyprotein from transposon TNT 1-94 n=1 Tax=Tanacetum coccineum TaxID=301880 RepID=A0ABQ4ZMT9_9ASTR
MDSALTIPMFQQREDPIECINKAMAFLSVVASRQTQSFAGNGNKGSAKNSRGNYAASQLRVVKCYNCQGEGHMTRQCTQPKRPRNTAWFKEKLMFSEAQEAGQILDEEQLAFLADPRIKDTLVAQQTIPQNSTFQTGDLDAYDSDCDDLSSAKGVLMANLSNCDSDVLSETRNAKFAAFQQEIDTLKETLSKNVKEKESLSKTLTVFKTESKEKESKYIDKEIVLEKQNKELENIICKMYRSMQAMHMLMKPQVFYNDTRKQALGYQNVFHLKKVQRIKPTLYDGSVLAKEHAVISVIDDEETLILEEESRSKIVIAKEHAVISVIDDEETLILEEESRSKIVFNQMKDAVDKCSVDKNYFEIQIKQLRIDNDQLLNQIMFQEIMHIAMTSIDNVDVNMSGVNEYYKYLELETELLKKKDFVKKDVFDKLVKAQSQEKDIVIMKLKEKIKSLSGKANVENVKMEIDEMETINIELEHNQFVSIKKTRVRSKEHSDSLIAQINAKSVENSDLNTQLQEKVFAIATLKNELRKLKGKNVVDTSSLKKTQGRSLRVCVIVGRGDMDASRSSHATLGLNLDPLFFAIIGCPLVAVRSKYDHTDCQRGNPCVRGFVLLLA